MWNGGIENRKLKIEDWTSGVGRSNRQSPDVQFSIFNSRLINQLAFFFIIRNDRVAFKRLGPIE